ncbi:transient receptor potential cation channel subfamily M member 7-like [Rhinoderma darwinii]|uniref:transient receptor potential cation channel subfamily M member 7-like n=1 Tax=Rhinoderma darwinii TaxID=43563 RepID=UPI003F66AAD6
MTDNKRQHHAIATPTVPEILGPLVLVSVMQKMPLTVKFAPFSSLTNLPWIERTFYERDCVSIIPNSREPHRCIPGCQICQQLVRCCCGRLIKEHRLVAENAGISLTDDQNESAAWTVETHTVKSPTNAYGTIDFQGGSQGCKAKFVRLSCDSKIEDILHLMVNEWKMQLPKLLISVHGGTQKFDLHPRIKDALSKGLAKAAETTKAWILTGGVNNGVAEHIGNALKDHTSYLCHKVCTIGITPWGLIDGRQDLSGRNVVAPYQTLLKPLSKLHLLNSTHSHFILVDDGTVGQYGADIRIRQELESRISLQQIHARTGKRIPIVALILEGGPNTIPTVYEYLQQTPPVPVVVCEGSGRAADLLAFVYKQTESQGTLLEGVQSDVIAIIKKMFSLNQSEAIHMFYTLMACMKTKHLITIFHAGPEEQQDIDVAILTSLLKSTNVSPYDQLVLALAWDRVDIAKNYIFIHGQQWLTAPLEQAMMDALVMDRVAFVQLLIEHGVSMHRFLTIPRLEELYNAAYNSSNDTILHLIQNVKKGKLSSEYKITLMDVGLVIEYLMGGTFRCSYTKKSFRTMYKLLNQNSMQNNSVSACKSSETLGSTQRREKTRHNHFLQTAQPYKPKVSGEKENPQKPCKAGTLATEDDNGRPFHYPFNDLLVWAVLMKRQKMALFFWQRGEESMAKALVARCLYRAMSHEARQWDIFDDTPEKLNDYSKEFGNLAVELLDKTYKQNEILTMKLLTYQLSNWSNSTCLKLAVSGRLRTFVSHACTQKLLTDMWIGRLNLRKNYWFKVILGILLPPIIPLLEYKTRAQMSHIPVSQDAHEMILNEGPEVKFNVEGGAEGIHKEAEVPDGFGGNVPGMRSEGKPHRLPLAQKYFAFYHAPIVKFWFNTLAYLAFLMLYTYVVLVKMESLPSVQEWIVFLFIVTTAVEITREIFISEAGKSSQKLKVWLHSYLNVNEFLGIMTFFVGFCLRFGSSNVTNEPSEVLMFTAGRLVYCLNTIFWFVKLLDILNVNKDAGPYVFMIGKMMSRMFFIVVIMGIVVFSFGVPRKAILYPNEEPSWSLAKDVVFRPYWMTYGEMFAYEIDECANDTVVHNLCGTGTWLNGFLQAVYVFVQYIIMVNLLIAIFNNVYLECKGISDHLWKFQRYYFVMFYHNKPVLPPPFILLNHFIAVMNWLCGRRKRSNSQGPQLFLTEEDKKRLHEFEEECVQIYFHDKKDDNNSKSDERIRVTSERVEDMFGDMKDVRDHVNSIKSLLDHLDDHIGHLQDLSGLTLDSIKTLTAQKAMESNRSHSIMSCDLSLSKQTTDDGLGQSTTWQKSRSSQIWARSVSQPGLEKYNKTSISLQRINGSEFGPIHNTLLYLSDQLPEFQHGGVCEEKNLDYVKHKSLKSRPHVTHETSTQNSSPESKQLQVPEVLNVSTIVQSKKSPIQVIPTCLESASSSLLGKVYKEEGFVNCAFTDDDNKALYENDPENGDQYFKSSSELKDKEAEQPSLDKSPNVVILKNGKDRHSNNNKLTGVFYKLWKQSKSPGIKAPAEKQTSPVMEPCHKDDDNLRRSHSCTELKELENSSSWTSRTQFDLDSRSMSFEDVYQTDSTAALLKEPYNSRYSSSYKLSITKEGFTKFGCNFKTSMDTAFYYSAIERNNLYRLSQSIPFTPLPPVGELVTVYRLDESSPSIMNNSMSSWSHHGSYATIEVLSKEEMGGGLRRAVKVACTWSQNDILKTGHLYIIKSFLPEVVNTWSGVYKADTVLQLCLREIQQQRAAQKLLYAFNQMKPKQIAYSPRFLEVFLLYCHSVSQWFTVEEYMAGRFRKYNNNTGSESVPSNKLEKTMLAFSHWTYEYTRGEFLVLDLQGVGENLTDPSVINAGEHRSQDMIFGPANLGDNAIKNFCTKHQCNTCCRFLKLPEIKRNEYITDEALLRGKSQVCMESCGTEAQANSVMC